LIDEVFLAIVEAVSVAYHPQNNEVVLSSMLGNLKP
jgi:hypothetical protein